MAESAPPARTVKRALSTPGTKMKSSKPVARDVVE
jgi:hypothetical protein